MLAIIFTSTFMLFFSCFDHIRTTIRRRNFPLAQRVIRQSLEFVHSRHGLDDTFHEMLDFLLKLFFVMPTVSFPNIVHKHACDFHLAEQWIRC